MSDLPEVSSEMAAQMRAAFLEEIFTDLEARTENWELRVRPLGDSMGFRAEMHAVSFDGGTTFVAGASSRFALEAQSQAVARWHARIEEALSEEDEDEEVDNDYSEE